MTSKRVVFENKTGQVRSHSIGRRVDFTVRLNERDLGEGHRFDTEAEALGFLADMSL